jgi:hypothetical protein
MKRFYVVLTVFTTVLVASNGWALDEFHFKRNRAGDQTFAVAQGYVNNYLLVAGVAKSITIPTGSNFALLSSSADVWVVIGAGKTAAIPSGDVTDGTGSELNPVCRFVKGETAMSVISSAAAKLSIMFYE